MKLSVSAWCLQEKLFGKEMTILDFIRFCHENGVKFVELLDCFLSGERDIKEVKELLKELDMKVSAYSISNDFVLSDSSDRRSQVEYMKKSMDTALELGTGIMRVFSGNNKDGMSLDMAEDWIVECFQEAAPLAEQKGITMVLENHGLLAGKSYQVKNIIDRTCSKALKSNADVGNFMLVNENPLEAVKLLKDQIGFLHLKDLKKVDLAEADSAEADTKECYTAIDGSVYQGAVLGKGDVPIPEIIAYMKASGYQGFLSIEFEGPGDPAEGTTECIAYARQELDK
ncbi:Sugar phosphate isomerase/epimerase [Anaerocolumna jejuensis DSM 15929]|uniref:Sugar phosphate isomerase/epimerase n=1 Tax=Anaerocolumna jejuensis DSM 15929 TaxID=1121322 RepID=A0A1M7CTL2_9FIRM|nr:sugar phosphate isomerase/epimerase [Anaerocolumna jejuensis]SHL70199.1 Sugar phosphate isomerase/epimerase [Anaerocolumna jejuensis DSM 15929]